MRYLTPKVARAMTATRPNPPTAATLPIRAVWFSWPESVNIKTSEETALSTKHQQCKWVLHLLSVLKEASNLF